MEDKVKEKLSLKYNPSKVLKNSGMQEGTSTKHINIMSSYL